MIKASRVRPIPENALEVDEDDAHVGYWAAAAVWFDAWDQRTVDRVSCFSVSCLCLY